MHKLLQKRLYLAVYLMVLRQGVSHLRLQLGRLILAQFALNVGAYRPRSQLLLSRLAVPRSSRVGESAPVMIHEIPEPFGSSAIRCTEKVPVQSQQQFYTLTQLVPPYKSDLSLQPESEWNRRHSKPPPHLGGCQPTILTTPVFNQYPGEPRSSCLRH
ncbi:hypothetical protein GOODEAATRI_003402 [Goodea atripinnis]|uniref:Uncharacterized protein n=1 Tax=Goodea atripinnis TaxID=208336 RepID=A0ABV0NH46_9TELE